MAASRWHWIHLRAPELGPQQLGSCPGGLWASFVLCTHASPGGRRSAGPGCSISLRVFILICYPSKITCWKDTRLLLHFPACLRAALQSQCLHSGPGCSDASSGTSRGGKRNKIIKPHELKGEFTPLCKCLFLLFLGNFRCVSLGLSFVLEQVSFIAVVGFFFFSFIFH